MKAENTKYVLVGGLLILGLGGMYALNRERAATGLQSAVEVAKAPETESVKSIKNAALPPQPVKPETTAVGDVNTSSAQDYGLPVLTMENIHRNPERPPDMPLADWEEYERQRYEMVQLKAYKFRQTDPAKVKPVEVATVLPEAAKKYDIPEDLLAALLYTSSDGGHHYAEHDIEGGFGLMMLKESPQCNTLAEAAELLGVSVEDVIYDQRLNMMGGAAVLRQYYDDAMASGLQEGEAWYMAIAQYSGRPQPDLAAALADQVSGNLIRGFEIDSEDGSGYYHQEANPTPIFQPQNWGVAGVDPPAAGGATEPDQDQANAVTPVTEAAPPTAEN